MKKEKEVLIIGAGLSGLTIAYRLERAGVSYKLIEGRDRVGGRIQTVKTSSGSTIEMGATWFSDKHQHLMQLIEELNVPYEHQYSGKHVLYDYHNGGRKVEAIKVPPSHESTYIFSNGTEDLTTALYSRLKSDWVFVSERLESLS